MQTKTCTKCKLKKELSEFYKDARTKDKVRNPCKHCLKFYAKKLIQKYPWKKTFHGIKQRCNNKKDISYKYYVCMNMFVFMLSIT